MSTLDRGVYKKIVISGDVIDIYEYSKPFRCDFEKTIVKSNPNDTDVTEIEKKNYNLSRARSKIRNLIWCNITPYTKLITLTTKDTMLNPTEFKEVYLKNFFRNMTRKGYKLNYLYVLEHQSKRGKREGNKGSIHAHIVVFNEEKIPFDVLKDSWNYGSVDIQLLKGLKSKNKDLVKNAAAYICKYISKDTLAEWGQHCFDSSKGLKRPQEISIKCWFDNDFLELEKEDFELYQSYVKKTKVTYRNTKDIYFFDDNDNKVVMNCTHTQGIYLGDEIE